MVALVFTAGSGTMAGAAVAVAPTVMTLVVVAVVGAMVVRIVDVAAVPIVVVLVNVETLCAGGVKLGSVPDPIGGSPTAHPSVEESM